MLKKAEKLAICLCAIVAIVAVFSGLNPVWAVADGDKCQLVNNVGSPINTWFSEGELAFAADGTMVFCTNRADLAVALNDPKDLYTSTPSLDFKKWNMPVNMGIPVNSAPATNIDPLRKGDDREPWITPDGNTIYFKSDRLATTVPLNANDIFVTHKVGGVWQTPVLVGYPVSTDQGNEHCPMLLKNGQLCFSSARAGGYGGYDIWCSVPDGAGGWQYPVNQGPNINTAGAEFHFMNSKDGKWVHFASSRPGGQGGTDIWASERQADGSWGPAVNWGAPFMTSGTDICPAFSPGDDRIYWFSSRGDNSYGNTDIYWAEYGSIVSNIGN